MPQEQPINQEKIEKRKDFVPKLMELNEKVLFGDIWERPGLSNFWPYSSPRWGGTGSGFSL